MGTQFVYTIQHQAGTPEAPTIKESRASFNVDMVIRSMELPDGRLVVILDDFHEEMLTLPDSINPNTNKVIRGKKELAVVQSEIQLSQEDKERFFNVLNVEESWKR